MFRFPLVLILLALSTPVQAQSGNPMQGVSPELPARGTIQNAYVMDVVITTTAEAGPFTAFLIRPPGRNARGEWFYIRNDDVAKALERGAMIGLLMGAAQANRWTEDAPPRLVAIEYVTVGERRMITAASLSPSRQ